MNHFTQLISRLDSTNKLNAKIGAMVQFFQKADNADKLWFLALFTGKRGRRLISARLMKEWTLERTGLPEWLFVECYSSVGDLGETIALVLPPHSHQITLSLSEWMQQINTLKDADDAAKKDFVLKAWDGLDYTERFIFNKLIGGSFRMGISAKMLVNAIAKYSGIDASTITHSIMGNWSVNTTDFETLIRGHHTNTDASRPYPFCLAYPVEKTVEALGERKDWQAEYKWDGIRGQFIRRNADVFIWSRGEELVSPQFPEVTAALEKMLGNFVLDGEILPVKDGAVLNFSELQKRLNRKNISKKMLEEIPVKVFVYDIFEKEGTDVRNLPLTERRALLEETIKESSHSIFSLSRVIETADWESLYEIRTQARQINAEGLMLKHKSSPYHSGRKKGDWWKWKIEPYAIDAVLIYAQRGAGRRSGHYTDYTFAVRDGDSLVTIAKAYSGLTDKEIAEVSRFINKNAIEKFGPVRTVKPELVFEITFEGIGFSNRHKSGVALRFPRILRWRKDKTVAEIDTLDNIKKLIH